MQSKIIISADKEGVVTRLKDSFYNAPYKLVHYGNKLFHEHLELIIMCSSPGVMDYDVLDMDVQINADAEVKLFTQSFNKIHPMEHGAKQTFQLKIEKDAIFQYVPHPVTPFESSIFETENHIHLEDHSSTLIFGDIFTSGRVHSGESFKFTKIHSQTNIYRDGKLIFKDNVLMEPKNQPVKKSLFWDEYTHHATLIFVSPAANDFKFELDEILTEENVQEVDFGFTQFANNSLIIRALSHSGEQLYDWMKVLSDMCWQFTQHYKESQKLPQDEIQTTEIKEIETKKALKHSTKIKKTAKNKV